VSLLVSGINAKSQITNLFIERGSGFPLLFFLVGEKWD